MTEKPPAGWYPDSTGTVRWWDGEQWTEHQPPPPPPQDAPTAASPEPVLPAAAENETQANAPVKTRADAKAEKAYRKASRPWYKKKRWIGLIAMVVLIAIIAATSSSNTGGPEVVDGSSEADTSSGDSSSGGDSNKAGSKSNPLNVGQAVELEGTRYTIESARKSQRVGDQFFQEKANGVFVIVKMIVENKKDETRTFSDEAAKFISTDGKRYSTDSDGTIASAGEDDSFLFMDMQPDVPETGTLVYDVPTGKAKGGLLEVRDLFGGGEAYIDLGL